MSDTLFTQDERDTAERELAKISRVYLEMKWAGIAVNNSYPYDDVKMLLAVIEAKELRIKELEQELRNQEDSFEWTLAELRWGEDR